MHSKYYLGIIVTNQKKILSRKAGDKMKISKRILNELYSKYQITDDTNIFDIKDIMSVEDYAKWELAFKYPNGKPLEVIEGGKNGISN